MESLQEQAIHYTHGNTLLLAGPGTGKTLTITEHIYYLIKNENVLPSKILALTFTNAAAKEMEVRLKKLGLKNEEIPEVRTLHSFCFKELRKTTKTEFVGTKVLDDWEERYILEEDLRARILKSTIKEIEELIKGSDSNWATLTPPPPVARQSRIEAEFDNLRKVYGFVRRGELVFRFKKYLDGDPKYNPAFEHIIVDEYQDLNRCDLYVIHELVRRGSSVIYAAGDDDQCLYHFRNASPEGIRNFERDYPGVKKFIFKDCYRCAAPILEIAQELMRHEEDREEKNLKAVHDFGSVKILAFNSDFEELSQVADIVKNYKKSGIELKDILVLVTKSILAQKILEGLNAQKIDSINLARKLEILSEKDHRKFLYAFEFSKNEIKQFALRGWLECLDGISKDTIYDLINEALTNDTSLLESCQNSDNPRVRRALQELNQLSPMMIDPQQREFQYSAAGISIEEQKFLENEMIDPFDIKIDIIEEDDEKVEIVPEEINKVRIMSMRGAKGLDARITIIVGVEEHLIPAKEMDVAEQRRLLYVSLTRAKQSLIITHCHTRTGVTNFSGSGAAGSGGKRKRSKFLEEIGKSSEEYKSEDWDFDLKEKW